MGKFLPICGHFANFRGDYFSGVLGPEDAIGPGKALGSRVAVLLTVDRRPVLSAPGPVRVSEHAGQGTDLGVMTLEPSTCGTSGQPRPRDKRLSVGGREWGQASGEQGC